MRVIVCSFSGAISDMKKKDQRDEMKVLAVLSRSPRFSCFDASENQGIANSITNLKKRGLIEYPKPQPEFPWCKVKITDAGNALLKQRTE